MGNQVADHVLYCGAVDIHVLCEVFYRFLRRTDVRLLARVEFGIDDDAVFQIVDAQSCGLPKSDRAQVAGNLEATRMRVLNRHLELIRCD